MSNEREALAQLLGAEPTDDEVALFRAHGIVTRPTRNQRVQAAIAAGEAIRCPECQMVSWNPNDVREGYCGNCHQWTSADWFLEAKELADQQRPALLPIVIVDLAAGLDPSDE